MSISTDEIRDAKFRRTRLREGYDRDEVEAFHQKAVTAMYERDQDILSLQQELANRAPVEEVIDDFANDGNKKDLLTVARRLYEQHVAEGIQQRDIIISEARVVASRLISESESALRARLSDLNTQREEIELAILQKVEFEKNYSAGLKSFMKGQAEKLEMTDSTVLTPKDEVEPAAPVVTQSIVLNVPDDAPVAATIADINAMSVAEDDEEEPIVRRGSYLPATE